MKSADRGLLGESKVAVRHVDRREGTERCGADDLSEPPRLRLALHVNEHGLALISWFNANDLLAHDGMILLSKVGKHAVDEPVRAAVKAEPVGSAFRLLVSGKGVTSLSRGGYVAEFARIYDLKESVMSQCRKYITETTHGFKEAVVIQACSGVEHL